MIGAFDGWGGGGWGIEEFKKFNDDDPLRFLLVFRAKSGRLSQRQRCTVPDSMDSIGQVPTC